MQKPVAHTILTRAASTLFNFAIVLLIARHAGPAIKGEVTLIVTIVSFYAFFSNIFGGQVLVYLIPQKKSEQFIFPAYLWFTFIALLGYLLLYFSNWITKDFVPPVIIIGFLFSITGMYQSILLSRKEIYKSNFLTVFPLLLQFSGLILCYYVFKIEGIIAFLYATLGGYICSSVAGFLLTKQPDVSLRPSSISKMDIKNQWIYGTRFQFLEILQLVNLRYYFFQLGLQQGAQYLGVFSIGISVLEAVWIIPRSMATVNYVNTSNSADNKLSLSQTIKLLQWNAILTSMALCTIYLIPSWVFENVFGPGFSDVKHSIRFLYPGIWIYSFHLIVCAYFYGKGKYLPILLSNMSGAISLIIFSHFLIPVYVMSGAGLAASISFAIATLVSTVFFIREAHKTKT